MDTMVIDENMTTEEFVTIMQLIRKLIEKSDSIEGCLKDFDNLKVIRDLNIQGEGGR